MVIEIRTVPKKAKLEVDGAAPTPLPDGRLELDPGKHVFVVRAEGHETTTVGRTLSADDVELTSRRRR